MAESHYGSPFFDHALMVITIKKMAEANGYTELANASLKNISDALMYACKRQKEEDNGRK